MEEKKVINNLKNWYLHNLLVSLLEECKNTADNGSTEHEHPTNNIKNNRLLKASRGSIAAASHINNLLFDTKIILIFLYITIWKRKKISNVSICKDCHCIRHGHFICLICLIPSIKKQPRALCSGLFEV